MALTFGTKLGPYEIQSPLGAGGMGEVYKARDTRLERTVAIKVLPEQFSTNADFQQRFEREAKAISSLSHPNICTLYDVGQDGGRNYLVLEFLEGESLAKRLAKGALPLKDTLRVGGEIAEALDKAHRAGVVHRDLKPGNIMLTKSGAKLLDFGLAKPQARMQASAAQGAVTLTSPADPITQQGTLVGTFHYMSPEQVEGREADARSDIFALGAVLYEMATGKRAFEGRSQISIASAILEKDPEPISVAQPMSPPALDHVVRTCIEKDAEQRYQTAHDVALELRWISEAGSQAGLVTPLTRHRWRLRWLPWAAAAVALLAGATGGWLLRGQKPASVVRASIDLPANTNIGAADSAVAFSPDGRRLAITVAKDGTTAIWLRSLDSVTAQPLAGTEGATYPTWSPDGRALAFFADHKVKRIDVASGMVETICDADDGRGMAWGPDDTIVFSPGAFTGLYAVPAAGGTPIELTKPAATGDTHRLPLFLPGGKTVLYFNGSASGSRGGLDAVSLTSKQTQHILDTNSGARYVVPGYLLYIKGGSLLAQPFDASRLKTTGNPVPLAEHVQFATYRWTGAFDASSGGALAYEDEPGGGKYQWTWVDRSGKVLGKVGEPNSFSLLQAVLSPNDKTVATSDQAAIWLYDLTRGVASRLTFDAGGHAGPVWSPDGKSVMYAAVRSAGDWTINVAAASGNSAPQVVYRGPLRMLPTSWSPDGKFVALEVSGAEAGAKDAIWIMPMSGDHKPYPFVQGNGNTHAGQFSPDGHWLVFSSDESGRTESYVVPFPRPSGKWQISTNGEGGPGEWLSNNEVVYLSTNLKLYAAQVKPSGNSIEIGQPRPLLEGQNLASANGAVWTHDGKRILMAIPLGNSKGPQLNLVTNWTLALKK